jgi:hypothetical protein
MVWLYRPKTWFRSSLQRDRRSPLGICGRSLALSLGLLTQLSGFCEYASRPCEQDGRRSVKSSSRSGHSVQSSHAASPPLQHRVCDDRLQPCVMHCARHDRLPPFSAPIMLPLTQADPIGSTPNIQNGTYILLLLFLILSSSCFWSAS